MQIRVRVRPLARSNEVGGRYGDGDPPVLVVRVQAGPYEGRANASCIEALAQAFDVPRHAVTIVAGKSARSKLVEVQGADPARLASLLSR